MALLRQFVGLNNETVARQAIFMPKIVRKSSSRWMANNGKLNVIEWMRNDQQHSLFSVVRRWDVLDVRLRTWARKNLANKMELYRKKMVHSIRWTLRVWLHVSCRTDKVIKYNLDNAWSKEIFLCAKKIWFCQRDMSKKWDDDLNEWHRSNQYEN